MKYMHNVTYRSYFLRNIYIMSLQLDLNLRYLTLLILWLENDVLQLLQNELKFKIGRLERKLELKQFHAMW